jgi:hypothetical protein
MAGLLDVLERPYPCACACHEMLSAEERAQGVSALFRLDDAFRGWDYDPIYELGADRLFRAQKERNDAGFRGIAMRDDTCNSRRLVGFAIHEMIHLLDGDPTKSNYGMPWGLPYGVPPEVGDDAAYLDRFNRSEARAWVGVATLARHFFSIAWQLLTARDVGTYGFPGGNALVDVPPGYRAVPHWDPIHHKARYYALARKLEEEERAFFTDEKLAEWRSRFEEAERRGAAKRKQPWPAPEKIAAIAPRLPDRNDPCLCGSGKKYKKCCGA